MPQKDLFMFFSTLTWLFLMMFVLYFIIFTYIIPFLKYSIELRLLIPSFLEKKWFYLLQKSIYISKQIDDIIKIHIIQKINILSNINNSLSTLTQKHK